jgi:DNA-binding transcriptional LysR family regulator
MELRHLRYFIAVAESLHFGRAARRLQLAQPSLSHQIRQLETEVQVRLLERTKRRVELTPAGCVFLDEAREIVARADHAALIARQAGRRGTPPLRVGVGLCMDQAFTASVVSAFQSEYHNARVEIRTMAVSDQILALRADQLDVGFLRSTDVRPPLSAETLFRESLVVALPAAHRLTRQERVSLPALSSERFVLVPRGAVPVYHSIVLEACRGAGFIPDAPQEADHLQLIMQLVARGTGIALVPTSAQTPKVRGVVFRALRKPVPEVETAIARRLDGPPIVNEFVTVARALARDSIGGHALGPRTG